MATKRNKVAVIVRDNRAGVYYGYRAILAKNGEPTVLANARHIWSWRERLSTADIAARGLGPGSKITAAVDEIVLRDVIAEMRCTEEAIAQIEKFEAWSR